MKSILRILADLLLLPVTGCIFPGNRDYSEETGNPPATIGRPHQAGPGRPGKRIKLADQFH